MEENMKFLLFILVSRHKSFKTYITKLLAPVYCDYIVTVCGDYDYIMNLTLYINTFVCSPRAGMSPLFSVWQMYDANWIGGNFMFVKDVSLLNNKKKTLQVIVVTDDSSRSDSLPHYPHFLKGSTIR